MDIALLTTAVGLTLYLPSRHITRLDSTLESFRWGTASLGLSIGLFALSIIEVAPSSWLILIDNTVPDDRLTEGVVDDATGLSRKIEDNQLNDDDLAEIPIERNPAEYYSFRILQNGKFPLTTAYQITLWMMSILVILLLPSALGILIASRWCAPPVVPTDPTTPIGVRSSPSSNAKITLDHVEAKKRIFTTSTTNCHWSIRALCRLVTMPLILFFAPLRIFLSLLRKICCRRDSGPILAMTDRDNVTSDQTILFPRLRKAITVTRNSAFLLLNFIYQKRILILGTTMGLCGSFSLLSSLSPLVIETTSPNLDFERQKHQQHVWLLATAVSWMAATGIILASLLNGFGSVSMPYSCLAGLYLEPVHPEAIAAAEDERDRLIKSREDRLQEANSIPLHDLGSPTSLHGTSTPKRATSSPLKIQASRSFAEMGEELTQRRSALMTEVEFLETLLVDVNEDINEMKESQSTAARARTKIGRIKSFVGLIFSIILLIRLVSSFTIIWNESLKHTNHGSRKSIGRPKVDIVTQAVLWMVGHNLVSQEDYYTMSQFIALLLALLLSVSQLRNFLRTTVSVNHRLSNLFRKSCYESCAPGKGKPRLSNTPNTGTIYFFLHLVAALMSCYCLACVALTKMMLPHRYRAAFSYTLAGSVSALDHSNSHGRVQHELFRVKIYSVTVLFTSSALLSSAILGIMLAIQRQNTRRYLRSSPGRITTPAEQRALRDNIDDIDP